MWVYSASLLSRTNSAGQLLEEEAIHRLEVEIHYFQLFGPDDCKRSQSSLQTITAVAAVIGMLLFSGELHIK